MTYRLFVIYYNKICAYVLYLFPLVIDKMFVGESSNIVCTII